MGPPMRHWHLFRCKDGGLYQISRMDLFGFCTFMKVYESRYMIHHSDQCWSLRPHKKFGAIRCSDAMLSTTLQCTQVEFGGPWRPCVGAVWLYSYTPINLCCRWWLNRQLCWLKWLTTWPPCWCFWNPPQKAERQGIPKNLWSQSFGGYNNSCCLLYHQQSGYHWEHRQCGTSKNADVTKDHRDNRNIWGRKNVRTKLKKKRVIWRWGPSIPNILDGLGAPCL